MGPPVKNGSATDGSPSTYSDSEWSPPQISVAVIKAKAGVREAFQTSWEKGKRPPIPAWALLFLPNISVPTLRQHIDERIAIGLTEAWMSEYGYQCGPDASPDFLDTDPIANSPEERWARAFSEAVSWTSYGQFANIYNYIPSEDMLFNAFPGVIPVGMACQHLSTLCARSRGIELPAFNPSGIGIAGQTTLYARFPFSVVGKTILAGDGITVDGKANTRPETTEDLFNIKLNGGPVPLTPGSIVYRNNNADDVSVQNKAHIGSVLRHQAPWVQFIDTADMVGDKDKSNGTRWPGDKAPRKGLLPYGNLQPPISKGAAILPQADPAKLAAATTKLESGLYFGLCRFVITHNGTVLHVSKLEWMNCSTTKLIWSLRGLPVDHDIQVSWLVFVPRWPKASTNPDKHALFNKVFGAFCACNPPRPSDFIDDDDDIRLFNVIVGRPGASPDVAAHFEYTAKSEWRTGFDGTPSGMPKDVTNAQIDGVMLTKWCTDPANIDKGYPDITPTPPLGSESTLLAQILDLLPW